MASGVLLGGCSGGELDESRVSTKHAKLMGASGRCKRLRSELGSLGGCGVGGLNLCGSAHPCQWRDLVVVNVILMMGCFLRHVVSAINGHNLRELPIISFVLKDAGEVEGWVFAAGVDLEMSLLRDLLDNEIRHREEDKMIARDCLNGAKAEH